MSDAGSPWWRDAIVYQTHVKAFHDANGDGVGDFAGLTQKLDHLQSLGVTAIWLLPFYPSPLRDDGYDIADYKGIHPSYGTMHDFRTFVRAAHRRGLKIVTELVINHTSDQHPWFQRARRAKPGSSYRDFYVWSDSDQKYAGTRIIFSDTEKSNWTWDPVAGQYFWHRFFSHQPDLNFENPRVFDAVVDTMRFWFDAGVDGMRLDAVPYLAEREGTSCENLPETHAILKRMRAVLDREYPDRFFLAEANQWPEDVSDYFGDGDECQMCFHFPLMPRIFMAVAEEDRYPIYDIMRQTPDIPANCQWAIFLRNHDELTLEMVSERERAFMREVYASDPRAFINMGIRRRLAPLLENDRSRIELLNSLLMSMPGTPIVYYGDEIGMGDNVFLGDRDGVRTPMQWSVDRNGGFSFADAQKLYLPPIMDPVYGYNSINVEAQERTPSSLLNWMKRLITVRKTSPAFGRGTLSFLYPGNRRVIAYLREYEDQTVLCVANLSRSPQAVQLDLSRFVGRVPLEMLGPSAFPEIEETPYTLTLPGHAFYWFLLGDATLAPEWQEPPRYRIPELATLVLGRSIRDGISPYGRTALARDVLPAYLATQRWFPHDGAIGAPGIGDTFVLEATQPAPMLAIVEANGTYAIPFTIDMESDVQGTRAVARVRSGAREGFLIEGFASEAVYRALVETMRSGRARTEAGILAGSADAMWSDASGAIRTISGEHASALAGGGDDTLVKLYRRLDAASDRELIVIGALSRSGFEHVPPVLGSVTYQTGDIARVVAIAEPYVENQGDGWSLTIRFLERLLRERRSTAAEAVGSASELESRALDAAERLGDRTARLHCAGALLEEPALAAIPFDERAIAATRDDARGLAQRALDRLEHARATLPDVTLVDVDALLGRHDEILARFASLPARISSPQSVVHGDLHLGNVLVTADDVLFIGFANRTPLRSSVVRDVASMLRSYENAALYLQAGLASERAEDVASLAPFISEWRTRAQERFLHGYRRAIGTCSAYPNDPELEQTLLAFFRLERAMYEVAYEVENRSTWVRIAVRAALAELDRR